MLQIFKRKKYSRKKGWPLILAVCFLCITLFTFLSPALAPHVTQTFSFLKKEPIKWVEFNVPYSAMEKAMNADIDSHNTEHAVSWIEILAYLGTKYGGDFSRYRAADMDALLEQLRQGEYAAHLAKSINPKLYSYYLEAYGAILGGFLGEYQIKTGDSDSWKTVYGLKAFSPIAAGYWYNDYDDFGAGRSYGYQRKHLGHDLMISTGTPIVAIESGIVEALGWNQYGGWRIGIRSLDGKRYYYYAHLRKDTPYASNLYAGKLVTAGDVIGYSGQTGYSAKANSNNIDSPHLHYGMQLIFDESKKDSSTQIWIDLYDITRLLSTHRADVVKMENSYDFVRKYPFIDNAPEIAALTNQMPAQQPHTALKKKTGDISGKLLPQSPESNAKTGTPAIQTGAAEHPKDSIKLPILMYHGLLKDTSMQNKFVISPARFESDLKYLKKHGYTTIFMSDLIDSMEKGSPLPEKPIILTFDDGYYNNYLYAYPILKKYHSKAVISIIGHYTDLYSETDPNHPTYSHVTWDQLDDMINSGLVEVQNHTYDMHTYDKGRRGAMQRKGESNEDYQLVLDGDVARLQQKILKETGRLPDTFAYPFGFLNENSDQFLKKLGFSATLSCSEGINYLSPSADNPEEQLYSLKRILRPPDLTSEDFFQRHEID